MSSRFSRPVTRRTRVSSPTPARVGAGVPERSVAVAREATPAYEAGGPGKDASRQAEPTIGTTARDAIEGMVTSIGAAVAIEHDELSDPELEAALTTVQRSYDQLAMLRSSLVATLQSRAIARAPAGKKAAGGREGTRFLRDELHLPPGEAKQASEVGRQLRDNDRTRAAWQAGDVGQGHAAVIARTLPQVEDHQRDSLEVELLDAARRMDPVALGRHARRRVGELRPAVAERSERRRHLFRRASVRQDDAGDVLVSGAFSGTQGETIMTSWRAFYDKPTSNDPRSHEQRAADAFEAMALAALRSGEASTQHGERPQVIVVVRQEDLLRGSGMAQLANTGSVPIATLGHLLRDSVMTHVAVDCKNAPIAVTTRVRSVPTGLWRALVARDGGCTWEGCSAPVGWCDVAHGDHPYATDGRLSPSNSALLCRTHHRRFDHGPWSIEVQGNTVTYRHRGKSPPENPDGPTGGPGSTGGPESTGGEGQGGESQGGRPPSRGSPGGSGSTGGEGQGGRPPSGGSPGGGSLPASSSSRQPSSGKSPPARHSGDSSDRLF